MKNTQELLKKSANLQALIPPRQKLDLSRFIKAWQMSRSIELTGFQIIASNVFILKGYLFMGLYNSIGLGKSKICVNLFGIGEPINLLFKRGGKKKNLILGSFIRFSFWNPSLLLQKKEFLLRFLVFLCESAANQLQQSKGCCGVSHVLGFVQRSKLRTGIRASGWLVTYLGAVHQKWDLSLQNKSNWVLW